jgi:aminopeptidase N
MPTRSDKPSTLHPDQHSFSDPSRVRVRHLRLDLDVSFAQKTLTGTAELLLDRIDPAAGEVRLDTRALDVASAESAVGEGPGRRPRSRSRPPTRSWARRSR